MCTYSSQDNPCQHPVIILRDASYTDVEGLVRYVYRGEVDVQPQHLQSFLRTADALKIKGLADQGLDQQQQPQSQTSSQQQQDSSFKSESENEDPNPALDPIQSSRLIHQSSLQEPLKVPIPPSSQFRRSDSNSRFVRILYSLVV